jgi:putative transposase
VWRCREEDHIDSSSKRWPIAGKPAVLHTDNGKDFVSKALRQGCVTHGTRLEHRPVARPWYGGTVERVIDTCIKKMHQELPGTTFSNVKGRGEYA